MTTNPGLLNSESLLRVLGIANVPFSIGERQRLIEILRQTATTLRTMILDQPTQDYQQALVTTVDADTKTTEASLSKIQERASLWTFLSCVIKLPLRISVYHTLSRFS